MKKVILSLTLVAIAVFAFSQTNETNASLYQWKGKKTVPQAGYIILKSGKQVNGTLTLLGKPGALTQILLVENGKELKLPTSAVSAYGLGSERGAVTDGVKSGGLYRPVCDNNEELFVWRDMGEQMGKKIENTKPRNGYIIDRNGNRTEGELQIKRVDGQLAEFKLKGSSGKLKLTPSEVANYGLTMTIAEVTKDGEKTYKDEARNYHEGSITLTDGTVKNGWVAFGKRDYINQNKPGMGYKYDGIFFTSTKDGYLKTYSNDEIIFVSQKTPTEELKYSPYEGGFVAENALDNVTFRDDLREMNPGKLTLADGSRMDGDIAKFDAKSLNYKDVSGIIKKYEATDIDNFVVTTKEGKERTVINLKGELTEQLIQNETFWAYINPNPTTVNEKKTSLARSAAGMSTSLAGAAVMRNDAKKEGYESNIDSVIMNSNLQQLKDYQISLWKINGYTSSEQLQDNSTNESAKKFDAALNLAIAGKEMQDDIIVYYEEIILINQKTNEKYILYKNKKDMNSQLEGLLNGCYTFLTMDKKEQKRYYDVDNIKATLTMLSECY